MTKNKYGNITIIVNGRWVSMSALKFNQGIKTLKRVARGCHARHPRQGYCHAIAYRSCNSQNEASLIIMKIN